MLVNLVSIFTTVFIWQRFKETAQFPPVFEPSFQKARCRSSIQNLLILRSMYRVIAEKAMKEVMRGLRECVSCREVAADQIHG